MSIGYCATYELKFTFLISLHGIGGRTDRLTISANKTKVTRTGTNEDVAVNIQKEAQEMVTWVKYTLEQP